VKTSKRSAQGTWSRTSTPAAVNASSTARASSLTPPLLSRILPIARRRPRAAAIASGRLKPAWSAKAPTKTTS